MSNHLDMVHDYTCKWSFKCITFYGYVCCFHVHYDMNMNMKHEYKHEYVYDDKHVKVHYEHGLCIVYDIYIECEVISMLMYMNEKIIH